jgi:tyrosinase
MHSLGLFLSCLVTYFSASPVTAAPSPATNIVEDLLKRQDPNIPFPVTGVHIGQVLPRYEIRTLQNNYPDQFNVYLLGLQQLQSVDQSNYLSWYQISGIHGVPRIAWNGVAGVGGNGNNPGYCTHTSNLFLPWHRPYLALYEVCPL